MITVRKTVYVVDGKEYLDLSKAQKAEEKFAGKYEKKRKKKEGGKC